MVPILMYGMQISIGSHAKVFTIMRRCLQDVTKMTKSVARHAVVTLLLHYMEFELYLIWGEKYQLYKRLIIFFSLKHPCQLLSEKKNIII